MMIAIHIGWRRVGRYRMQEVTFVKSEVPPYGKNIVDINASQEALFAYSKDHGLYLGKKGNVAVLFPVGQAVPENEKETVHLMFAPEEGDGDITIENVEMDDLVMMFELGLKFLDNDVDDTVSVIGWNVGMVKMDSDPIGKASNVSWGRRVHVQAMRLKKDLPIRKTWKHGIREQYFSKRTEQLLREEHEEEEGVKIVDGLPEDVKPFIASSGSLVLEVGNPNAQRLAMVAKNLDSMYRKLHREVIVPDFYSGLERDSKVVEKLRDKSKVHFVPTYACLLVKSEGKVYLVFHPDHLERYGMFEAGGVQGERVQVENAKLDKRLERARREAERILA